MSKIFIISFVVISLALIQAALGLKCMENDKQDQEKFVDVECQSPGATQSAACLTEIFLDADKKEVVIKKCVMYQKTVHYECPKMPNTEQKECKICMEDLCNNSAKSFAGISFFTIIGVIMAFIVPKILL